MSDETLRRALERAGAPVVTGAIHAIATQAVNDCKILAEEISNLRFRLGCEKLLVRRWREAFEALAEELRSWGRGAAVLRCVERDIARCRAIAEPVKEPKGRTQVMTQTMEAWLRGQVTVIRVLAHYVESATRCHSGAAADRLGMIVSFCNQAEILIEQAITEQGEETE